MMKSFLNPDQRQTVEIIESLGFGSIEGLWVRGGSPTYEPEPRIVQAIKLDTEPHGKSKESHGDLTLKREFESLFEQLSRLQDGFVDIEVRHSLPFKLVVSRRYQELL